MLLWLLMAEIESILSMEELIVLAHRMEVSVGGRPTKSVLAGRLAQSDLQATARELKF